MKGGPACVHIICADRTRADKQVMCSWYPTMSLSLDYKSKFPLESTFATRTFGLYSTTKSIHEGRHDLTVEVWAAPADLGARKAEEREREQGADGVERWRREGARLVGVSTQVRPARLRVWNIRRVASTPDRPAHNSPQYTLADGACDPARGQLGTRTSCGFCRHERKPRKYGHCEEAAPVETGRRTLSQLPSSGRRCITLHCLVSQERVSDAERAR